MKSKEIEYFTKLNEEWRKKEQERDKIFKATEAKLQALETRLKQKANDLQKREQKVFPLDFFPNISHIKSSIISLFFSKKSLNKESAKLLDSSTSKRKKLLI